MLLTGGEGKNTSRGRCGHGVRKTGIAFHQLLQGVSQQRGAGPGLDFTVRKGADRLNVQSSPIDHLITVRLEHNHFAGLADPQGLRHELGLVQQNGDIEAVQLIRLADVLQGILGRGIDHPKRNTLTLPGGAQQPVLGLLLNIFQAGGRVGNDHHGLVIAIFAQLMVVPLVVDERKISDPLRGRFKRRRDHGQHHAQPCREAQIFHANTPRYLRKKAGP